MYVRIVVRSDHEELVESVEEGLYHLERHDSLKSQVCRTSIRRRPGARRISPRSSQPQEHATHAFEPPRCLPARSQVEFSLRSRTVLF